MGMYVLALCVSLQACGFVGVSRLFDEDAGLDGSLDTDAALDATRPVDGPSLDATGIVDSGPTDAIGDTPDEGGDVFDAGFDAAVPACTFPGALGIHAGRETVCVWGDTERCWGNNEDGVLQQDPVLPYAATPTPLSAHPASPWRVIVLSNTHACGVGTDDALWCWGSNYARQLSRDPAVVNFRLVPLSILPGPISAASAQNSLIVALGGDSSCVLNTVGELFCWGDNQAGQLGVGVDAAALDATQVPGIWNGVSVGQNHACGLQGDELYCWGSNSSSELGRPPPNAEVGSNTPVRVIPEEGFVQISAGSAFTCGTTTEGQALCWGSDLFGQLTLDPLLNKGSSSTPVPVAGLPQVTSVIAGDVTACAIDLGGSLWCWGANASGQTGQPPAGSQPVPRRLPGRWLGVSVGSASACGLRTDSSVWCWGDNSFGQLGQGDALPHDGLNIVCP